jgi:hypothetical protein
MTSFRTRSLFFLLLFCLTLLPGCASKNHSVSGMKVGMHIDAVLELVMEYPLQWEKDRRLEYGRNEGEIRWSHPKQKGTSLQVTSRFRQYQSDEQELEWVLKDDAGLTTTLREQVELPAGQVWHVSGQAAQQQVEIYLFLKPRRTYKLVLRTTQKNAAAYQNLMEKVTHSFQTWSQ